jgi:hypothetical protein
MLEDREFDENERKSVGHHFSGFIYLYQGNWSSFI